MAGPDLSREQEPELEDYLDEIVPEEVGGRDVADILAFVRPYLAPHRGRLALLVLVLVLHSAVNLSFPLVTQHLVDDGLLKKDWSVVSFILAFLAFAAVAIAMLGFACDWLSVRLGVDVVAALRERLFERLQHLPIPFFERTAAGTLLSRFSGDVVAVETAVTTVVPWFILPALEVVYSVVLMVWFNVRLALVGLLLFPLVLLVPRVFARRAFALSYDKRGERRAGSSQPCRRTLLPSR